VDGLAVAAPPSPAARREAVARARSAVVDATTRLGGYLDDVAAFDSAIAPVIADLA
jgi:hypothetical protein